MLFRENEVATLQMIVGSVFFAKVFVFTQIMKMILSVCAALIIINESSCYFVVYYCKN